MEGSLGWKKRGGGSDLAPPSTPTAPTRRSSAFWGSSGAPQGVLSPGVCMHLPLGGVGARRLGGARPPHPGSLGRAPEPPQLGGPCPSPAPHPRRGGGPSCRPEGQMTSERTGANWEKAAEGGGTAAVIVNKTSHAIFTFTAKKSKQAKSQAARGRHLGQRQLLSGGKSLGSTGRGGARPRLGFLDACGLGGCHKAAHTAPLCL